MGKDEENGRKFMQQLSQAIKDDQRLYDLSIWAREQLTRLMPDLTAAVLQESAVLVPVSGDASFRRYFRLCCAEHTWICVDAPPAHEDNGAFIRMAELLNRHQIQAPQVLSFELSSGFMLLTDMGDQLLLSTLAPDTVEAQYNLAMQMLLRLQQIPLTECQALPRMDKACLQTELDLFEAWFLPKYLRLTPDANLIAVLSSVYDLLIDSAVSQPQVLVHRDYHSRNLMWLDKKTLAQIDFQDAIIGPITYDLVSLLRDCYISWPQAQVREWVFAYARLAQAQGLSDASEAQWLKWFDWVGLQRHLRICGVFSRLCFRDGKSRYLEDIPLTVRYIMQVARRYPELSDFQQLWQDQLLTALYQVNPKAQGVIEATD
jgi:aminoglycoside/choline kinase family phosphotransferase